MQDDKKSNQEYQKKLPMEKLCEPKIFKGTFTVINDRGLHTRPCTELVKCAGRFKSKISLVYRKLKVNAKSLLGVLMLAAAKGAKVKMEAEGEDAEKALLALAELASKGFNIKY